MKGAVTRLGVVTSALALCLTGCGSDDGEGTIRVMAFGEEFIERGIAASDMDDGWAIHFDRFAVSLSDVTVAGQALAVRSPVNLVEPSDGEGQEIGSLAVAAGNHGEAAFRVVGLEVAGSASREGVDKAFDWVFDQTTRYDRCEAVTRVGDGETAAFQLTFHADHLFYDSLVSETPALRFQALADADADADGTLTRAELSMTGIGPYDPGSEGGVDDLWAWLVAATSTVGHVDGEGHCEAALLDSTPQ